MSEYREYRSKHRHKHHHRHEDDRRRKHSDDRQNESHSNEERRRDHIHDTTTKYSRDKDRHQSDSNRQDNRSYVNDKKRKTNPDQDEYGTDRMNKHRHSSSYVVPNYRSESESEDDRFRRRHSSKRKNEDATERLTSKSQNNSGKNDDGYEKKNRNDGAKNDADDTNPDSDEERRRLEFDFTKYKHSLNRIFFRDTDFIKRGSPEFDDFWAFLVKYQEFQKKKAVKSKDKSKRREDDDKGTLDLPQNYDNRYRINLTVVSKDMETFLKKGRLIDYDVERELTRDRVQQFKSILVHYLDFQQKQKLNKLKKIRRDQENLPIYQFRQMIVQMIKRHQIVIVAGDTGCGKSTQVPQYLLHAGFTKIACTQPRRIACISLSKRVGYETLNEFGSQVAYQVRFEKSKTQSTKILFLTEGLLLRQMTSDMYLSQYDVIVIDEVHERHIFTDFLLGVLKCLLKQREDLKLVLMSATINISLFSSYFENAPVIKVPGRLYPIQLEYCPIKKDELSGKTEKIDPSPYLKILNLIDHKYPANERGDVLIFLSGMTEIMAICDAVKQYSLESKHWIVLPLHSALSIQEQDKVFDIAPEGVRKCIVSTNIAETSVTIDGVRFIIDSGKVKEMNFDPKYKMQRLQEFWISVASSEQRKGRAGRTGPGVCFRLYDKTDHEAFQEFSTPEIKRVSLDTLILQMLSMGLPDARKFPFIEAPSMSSIENAVISLKEHGALKGDESLTPIGEMLSRLPVEVAIGKMLIMGSIFHMIDPVLSIAAAMSVQSPFPYKGHTDHEAVAARKPLESEHGDPFTLLNAFDEWIQVKAEGRGTKKWCKHRAMEEQRFYEMIKLKRQFQDLLKDHNLYEKVTEEDRYLTSDQRRQKHGERKRLRELKKEKNKESKKRKVLKLEENDYTISDGEEDDKGNDIKDLEFRLSNDLNQLQETANKSRHFTLRDINLLKIILCSGLYPQVAIADDCNTYKMDTDQAYHTKNKGFILIHPTSVFTTQPEVLQPPDIKDKKNCPEDLRGKLSRKHELLAFVSLLETNKPYLVNIMRVPALQTVTLFSNSIDTNSDCTRLVCDGWLEIRFADAESAQYIISSIIQLRSKWQNLLQLRLEDTFQNMDSEKKTSSRARRLEKLLAEKLTEFLESSVEYAIRRILAAEVQHLYNGPTLAPIDEESESSISQCIMGSGKEHVIKGGVQVNDYLVVNCLREDSSRGNVWNEFTSTMQKHWTCPQCDTSMIVTVMERLQHESECLEKHNTVNPLEEERLIEEERKTQENHLRKSYFCTDCDKQYSFTSTEILKHKKSHKTPS
ncbi:hypothetical protein SNE40_004514 [Patella caerulea]|uniref:ATP-dependent RNA helicase DHX34 n=1 Tax=Patella caerulea TaxID=87958 RepID=A0AAN8K327_PATCE